MDKYLELAAAVALGLFIVFALVPILNYCMYLGS
jgi:hypothetical protein